MTVSDAHTSFFVCNQVVVRVEHDLGPAFGARRLRVGYFIVPRPALADAPLMQALIDDAIDRHLRPWLWADESPFPVLTPFPSLQRLELAGKKLERTVATARARAVVCVAQRRMTKAERP